MSSGAAAPISRETALQGAQVPAHHRHHIGVDHGGRGALVLPDLGQDLGADAERQPRHAPLHDLLDPLLVHGIRVRVEEAYGEGLDALVEEPVESPVDLGGIEGNLDLSARVDPLPHLETQVALDERGRLLPRDVVEAGHAQAADLQRVAEARGGDEPGARAPQLEDGVGGHRGAVKHLAHVTAGEARVAEHLAEALDDGPRIVVDARRDLLRVDPPLGIEEDDVGEGATDVHTHAEARHLSGRRPSSPERRRRRPTAGGPSRTPARRPRASWRSPRATRR